MHNMRNFAFWFTLGMICMFQRLHADTSPVDFNTEVAPILAQHCVRCHAPGNRNGDISLETFADLNANGYVLAGDPQSSYLLELVSAINGASPAMPKDGEPLSGDQVALLRRWIAEGAKWPDDVIVRATAKADTSWWSLQPLNVSFRSAKGRLSVDDFIRAKLSEENLSLSPPADRRTLIRRATYDLLGLPPTPEEVAAFVDDPDPHAYEQLIDRLLASPHYGEQWGRHWLDVVRFGESNGYERNVIINELWPFRDFVIRSLNEDKPINQFIREHLAGDVFGKDDPGVAVGTAFLVCGPFDDVGNQDPAQAAQIRASSLDEIINVTGQAFLGMTVSCARCHDHKFDPITQRDYYGLYATFAGVRHGAVPLATPDEHAERAARIAPLNDRRTELEKALKQLESTVLDRAQARLVEFESHWTRPAVDRTGTEEHFETVTAKFVRLVCEALDADPNVATGFGIDEFEVWSDEPQPRNVALNRNAGRASGQQRQIEDFPGAYGPHHAIDGKYGARFLAVGNDLTIELAEPTAINRVVFSSARGEAAPDQGHLQFVAEYHIQVSQDGQQWCEVAHGRDRQPSPINRTAHLNWRMLKLETTAAEKAERARLTQKLAGVNHEMAAVPALSSVWIGTRHEEDAKGPFHVFLGGDPQKRGEEVSPASPELFHFAQHTQSGGRGGEANEQSVPQERLATCGFAYQLASDTPEAEHRLALADWIVHPDNPLTPRVLANRLWHYHFGTGIVDTPSDFGYMGGRPSHPELLDFLAIKLKDCGWRLKEMHRLIMTSQTYRQSSAFCAGAARMDGDARLLWRFPPQRLWAEEIRDTMLHVSGKLNVESPRGGPGFRLYHFMQDNVCTYVPLDAHGPETYRRAVYHQNARASVVDLMTEFDQPDCAFSVPKRAETTTPLQALTMLNHNFTLDMARFLAERLQTEAGQEHDRQIRLAFELCYSRRPTADETSACRELIDEHGLPALCRVLLNTSELIYVE